MLIQNHVTFRKNDFKLNFKLMNILNYDWKTLNTPFCKYEISNPVTKIRHINKKMS